MNGIIYITIYIEGWMNRNELMIATNGSDL